MGAAGSVRNHQHSFNSVRLEGTLNRIQKSFTCLHEPQVDDIQENSNDGKRGTLEDLDLLDGEVPFEYLFLNVVKELFFENVVEGETMDIEAFDVLVFEALRRFRTLYEGNSATSITQLKELCDSAQKKVEAGSHITSSLSWEQILLLLH
jgi:hypothetical protein